MHMDIDDPSRPFSSSSAANTLHFGTNTPFIFHSAPRNPGYEPYDPSKWAAKDFRFGFAGGSAGGTGSAEDVEMRLGDSPARQREAPAGGSPAQSSKSAVEPNTGQGKDNNEAKQFEVGQAVEGDGEGRKIASGAMTRVRRKRQKEWRRRRGSESEPDEVGLRVFERFDLSMQS